MPPPSEARRLPFSVQAKPTGPRQRAIPTDVRGLETSVQNLLDAQPDGAVEAAWQVANCLPAGAAITSGCR